jgi:hypothetical protein
LRDTFTFNFPGTPAAFAGVFRQYYGPTMNAFVHSGNLPGEESAVAAFT